MLHPSSCLPAQVCWQVTDVLSRASVLLWVSTGHGGRQAMVTRSPDTAGLAHGLLRLQSICVN